MNNLLTKKVIIVFGILITVVASAVIVAFTTGNTRYPSLSDPDGIFYERLDEQGKVKYSITNKELYEEMKVNDGLQQLLFMVDTALLTDYFDQVTDEMVAEKILKLKYGTADPDAIAEFSDEQRTQYDNDFKLNMVLSGYDGNEAEYAALVLVRDMYVRETMATDGSITDLMIAREFLNKTFGDIKAVRIRFTSAADARAVMQKFNIMDYNAESLREYLGYYYNRELLFDDEENLVEAYKTVEPFYFDEEMNILNLAEEIVYTLGEGEIYVDEDDNEYTLDEDGNLIDTDEEVVVEAALIHDDIVAAEAYKEANTFYYTVSKADPFDQEEDAVVKDASETIVYTIDKDGKIYDTEQNDVTASSGLYVNKVYAPITAVSKATLHNTAELSDEAVLQKYVQMYNYVYGDYRALLPEGLSIAELTEHDNDDLSFAFADVNKVQTGLATYMFKTLDLDNELLIRYTTTARSFLMSNSTYHFMVFKLTQDDDKAAYEELMLDHIESQIRIPLTIGDKITPMTASWYGSTIVWSSANTSVITGAGVVTKPSVDTQVEMTYRITFNSRVRSGKITVTVLADGATVPAEPSADTEIPFKTILDDDDLYQELLLKLVEEKMTASTATTTINTYLTKLREKYDFQIYDYLIGLEYHNTYASYDHKTKGHKRLFATLSGRPGAEDEAIEITADELFSYAMTKNPALYVMYASQFKELLATSYFENVFGTEKNLLRNKSERMVSLLSYVESVKDYYPYLQSLYAAYGMEFPYASFNEYIYLQFKGAKSETDLLEDAVVSSLQAYIVKETIDQYELIDLIYPKLEEYYDNYFSLYVTHLLIFFDFDENDRPDDYNDYLAGLTPAEADDFTALLASLESAIMDYLTDETKTLTTLASAYANATRDNETWGEFKQKGIFILVQELNETDDEDKKHSLEYFGEYGVAGELVPEFVAALKALYDEYNLPQNLSNTQMMSGLVATSFGNHLILGTKGDYFTQPSAAFAESDPENPVYDPAAVNASGKPTLAQLQLYAEYYFYDQFYDLTEAGVEAKYGFTIPKIPANLRTAIGRYASDLVANLYVLGTINMNQADRLAIGNFKATDYHVQTQAEMVQMLVDTRDAYYWAIYGKFDNE